MHESGEIPLADATRVHILRNCLAAVKERLYAHHYPMLHYSIGEVRRNDFSQARTSDDERDRRLRYIFAVVDITRQLQQILALVHAELQSVHRAGFVLQTHKICDIH